MEALKLPRDVDLALIDASEDLVPALIRRCAEARCSGAALLRRARLSEDVGPCGVRLLGPDCFGIQNPHEKINASKSPQLAYPGTVAFISQSSALGAAVLDWSIQEHVGFSGFVASSSMADVDCAELVQHFGDDPQTRSILLYLERLGDVRSFVSAARETALRKPVIVIRPRGLPSQDELTDELLDAAFRRCGVLRVEQISDLFYMAEVLDRQPRPRVPTLAIVTNAGGPGAMAAAALKGKVSSLAPLRADTMARLNSALPDGWSGRNPIDLRQDFGPQRYELAVDVLLHDPEVGGALVIVAPTDTTDPVGIAQALVRSKQRGKPVLASWMGARGVARAVEILNGAGIPTFPYPDTAARAFEYMCQYSRNLRSLYETPSLVGGGADESRASECVAMLARHRDSEELSLEGEDAAKVLECYRIASTSNESSLPVQLRTFVDAEFGPVIAFGLGGALGSDYRDEAMGLPPLNTTLARRLMENTRVYRALPRLITQDALHSLEALLVQLSRMVVEHRAIRTVTIGSLGVSGTEVVALNPVLTLFGRDVVLEELPKPAIRPYPQQYTSEFQTRSGQHLLIRPIRPEDEPLIVAFHRTLSETTVYRRYFSGLTLTQRTAHERLTRVCFIDYDREMALVAQTRDAEGHRTIVAVSRFIRTWRRDEAEFALVVSDQYQRQGLGAEMLGRLMEVARAERVRRLFGFVLPDNAPMAKLCERLQFKVEYSDQEEMLVAERLV